MSGWKQITFVGSLPKEVLQMGKLIGLPEVIFLNGQIL